MGKLVGVVKHVYLCGCMFYTLYVMYVSVGNLQKSVIPYKLSVEKLVGVVPPVDVRGYTVCTLYVMYVSVRNLQKRVVLCKISMGKLIDVLQQDDVRLGNVQNFEQL